MKIKRGIIFNIVLFTFSTISLFGQTKKGVKTETKKDSISEIKAEKYVGQIIDETLPISFDQKEFEKTKIGNGFKLIKIGEGNNTKYGVIDKQGKIIIESIYDNIREEGNLIILSLNGLIAVYNKNFKKILPLKYTSFNVRPQYNYIIVSANDTTELFDKNGKKINIPDLKYIVPLKITYNNPDEEFLMMLNSKGESAIFSEKQNKIVKDFELAQFFQSSEGTLIYTKPKSSNIPQSEETESYFLDGNMNYINSEPYLNMKFHEGYFICEKNNMAGVVDSKNNIIIPFNYKKLFVPINSHDPVFYGKNSNNKFGSISNLSKVIIPFEYDSLLVNTKYCIFKKENRYGIIDYLGTELIKNEYDSVVIFNFQTSKVLFLKNSQLVLVDFYGGVVNNFKYSQSQFTSNQKYYILETLEGRWGLINYDLTTAIPFTFDYGYTERFENGKYKKVYIFTSSDKNVIFYGNQTYSLASPYEKISSFNNIFVVKYKNKYGALNRKFEEIISCKYDKISVNKVDTVTNNVKSVNVVFNNKQEVIDLKEE